MMVALLSQDHSAGFCAQDVGCDATATIRQATYSLQKSLWSVIGELK
jgi:hypothetical protein